LENCLPLIVGVGHKWKELHQDGVQVDLLSVKLPLSEIHND